MLSLLDLLPRKRDFTLQLGILPFVKRGLFSVCVAIVFSFFSFSAYAKAPLYVQVGDSVQIGVPLTALFISLLKEDYAGTSELVEGAIWTSAETHTLKALVDRERPNHMDHNSFPSGHSSAAFQGAAFLQMRYGWAYGVPAYAAASFVGYSRIAGKYHYFSDVVTGASLAIGTQYIISKMGISLTNLWITPVIENDHYSLEMVTTF